MVYFTVDKDQDGSIRLVVMPQLWQFVVITIGLTVLVFMVWIVWQRMQIERLSRSRKEMDGGTNPWKAPSGTISNGGAVELQEQATHPFPQLARGPYRSRHFDLRGVNVDPALTYQF